MLYEQCFTSIYMILQVLFTIPQFKQYYYEEYKNHILNCSKNPSTCYFCQFCKLADGIYSDKYYNSINYDGLRGIKPRSFKTFVGSNHPEFSTNHQQDVLEYFDYLLTFMEKHDKKPKINQYFNFDTTRRLEVLIFIILV